MYQKKGRSLEKWFDRCIYNIIDIIDTVHYITSKYTFLITIIIFYDHNHHFLKRKMNHDQFFNDHDYEFFLSFLKKRENEKSEL